MYYGYILSEHSSTSLNICADFVAPWESFFVQEVLLSQKRSYAWIEGLACIAYCKNQPWQIAKVLIKVWRSPTRVPNKKQLRSCVLIKGISQMSFDEVRGSREKKTCWPILEINNEARFVMKSHLDSILVDFIRYSKFLKC